MPSTSKKQHNFMAAVAHRPAFAKKAGVPQSVGKDFNKADKGRKFAKGGDTMATKMNPGFIAMMAKKKGDKPDALAKHAAKPADKAHAGLTAKKMAAGGSTTMKKQAGAGRGFVNPQRLDESDEDYVTPKQRMAMETQTRESKDTEATTKAYNKASTYARGGGIESRGKTKGAMVSMQKFAGGGFVKSADGIATKGKTKATQVTMKKGGMC
jgi:hypothetical protein